MALNNSWYITISDAYTKGFVGGYNQVFTPTAYSNYLRNCRLENQGICMRDGYRVHTALANIWEVYKLKATEKNLYALVYTGWKVHLYKVMPTWLSDLWVISWYTGLVGFPEDYDIVAVWELLFILSKYDTIQTYSPEYWLETISPEKRPSEDGGTYPILNYKSSNGAYYWWFVFLNEIQVDNNGKYTPTNRIVLSHEINRDTEDWRDNATDFSARFDADNLEIPYKIILPSAVQSIISTQQNLYIFCQDSVQYLDKDILMQYATSKTLRTLPLAAWNSLLNRNSCIAAGNFVFFMCKDKHIRTLGYTSWIYDPQIADLTDTQFWIQRWIDDNIADEQEFAFAFFNKQDYNVEFHLRSKKADAWTNDIVLIRDLQHQQWLIDSWKSFSAMENYDWSRTASRWEPGEDKGIAHVIAGSRDHILYQTDSKYDTDVTSSWNIIVNPIKFEHNTVNMALWEIAERKLFNWVRLTGAINIHTGNTETAYQWNTALFEINVRVDWKQICNKKVNRQQVYDCHQRYQIEVWWELIPDYDPQDRDKVLKYDRYLFPIDLVLDQGMVRRKGKRIRVQVKSECPGSDLYLSWLAIRATPIGNFDLSDKF